MSQTMSNCDSSQGGDSVNQKPLLITDSEKTTDLTPSSKRKEMEVKTDDEKTEEGKNAELTPSSKTIEIEVKSDDEKAEECKIPRDAPDQNSASKRICLASIKTEKTK
ncbi:unnamed protein product [Arabis nemorensis]|uniref:Uncharacterized protein n=1 Tax=Arabis nemorensis TaxID=586526 RepID=A0A565BDK8_9BRAS|nr:unnamed protein product [Arabis nemorensis]